MRSFERILIGAFALGLAVLYKNYNDLKAPIPAPKLDFNEYWGAGSAKEYKENTAVKPFDISVNPQVIEDLKSSLSGPLKFQEPLEGVEFEYGFNSKYLQKVVKYWRDSYLTKWSEREAFLKKFPHFQTQIQGLNIHFIRVKPQKTNGKKVLPLLLLHGWPGSVREFYDIIPLLTTPNDKSDYVFEVIVPSLPGYGWSQAAAKKNMAATQMAIVMRNLMIRLGHNKFVIQGGDWGSMIGANLAALFPDNVLGYHSNMCVNGAPISYVKLALQNILPSFFADKEHPEFYPGFSAMFAQIMEVSGYMHIQATKPDTIGAALLNNPVGLAAYILEKFGGWTVADHKSLPDGGITKRFTMNAVLDNIMIYYLTDSITTSQRLYAENFGIEHMGLQMDRVAVRAPTGCARFKNDLAHSTDWVLKDRFVNLVHSAHYMDGGHFAAMELPQVLYDDIVEFMRKAQL